MEKLNVRFSPAYEKLIKEIAEKHDKTFSKVARDAMAIGVGIMQTSNNGVEYITPDYEDILGVGLCKWIDETCVIYQKAHGYA